MDRLQITLDAYEIDIRDRIVNTGTLLGLVSGAVPGLPPGPVPGCATLPNSTTPIPLTDTVISCGVLKAIGVHGNVIDPTVSYVGVALFTNGANTRTRGVEFTANYASDFGDMGHVDWSVGFNYNKTDITKLDALPAPVANPAAGQTTLLLPTAISQLTTAAPREKLVLGAYWTLGRFSANLRETIYGPATEIESPSGTGVNGVKVTVTHRGHHRSGYRLQDHRCTENRCGGQQPLRSPADAHPQRARRTRRPPARHRQQRLWRTRAVVSVRHRRWLLLRPRHLQLLAGAWAG